MQTPCSARSCAQLLLSSDIGRAWLSSSSKESTSGHFGYPGRASAGCASVLLQLENDRPTKAKLESHFWVLPLRSASLPSASPALPLPSRSLLVAPIGSALTQAPSQLKPARPRRSRSRCSTWRTISACPTASQCPPTCGPASWRPSTQYAHPLSQLGRRWRATADTPQGRLGVRQMLRGAARDTTAPGRSGHC
jgi:hypothetical protein